MNDKTILLIVKVLGVVFVVWGVFALLGLFAAGSSAALLTTGNSVLRGFGQPAESVPGSLGSVVILTLPICIAYFVAAFGLLKLKPWAYIALAVVGGLGLLTGFSNVFSLVWSIAYLWFAYVLFQHKQLFAK